MSKTRSLKYLKISRDASYGKGTDTALPSKASSTSVPVKDYSLVWREEEIMQDGGICLERGRWTVGSLPNVYDYYRHFRARHLLKEKYDCQHFTHYSFGVFDPSRDHLGAVAKGNILLFLQKLNPRPAHQSIGRPFFGILPYSWLAIGPYIKCITPLKTLLLNINDTPSHLGQHTHSLVQTASKTPNTRTKGGEGTLSVRGQCASWFTEACFTPVVILQKFKMRSCLLQTET